MGYTVGIFPYRRFYDNPHPHNSASHPLRRGIVMGPIREDGGEGARPHDRGYELTERDLQLAIVQHWRSSLVVAAPNYTPSKWWECDVWGVLRSGNWVEWECKISREDLRADAKKSERVWGEGMETFRDVTKYERLAQNIGGPSRFWYVVPESLCIDQSEIPDWAGFAMVRPWRGHAGVWHVHVVRPAPSRGRFKANPREIRRAQSRMWHRYWNCLKAMNSRGMIEPVEGGTDAE